MGTHRTPLVFSLQLSGIVLALLLYGLWWGALPRGVFSTPRGTLVLDSQGRMLDARIAADGQWRFAPSRGDLPLAYVTALVHFEDRRFFKHPGFDPLAILRAMRENMKARRVLSGGSTITMQVARLARGNRKRTLGQKFIELLLSLRLELEFDKAAILRLYADNAPFGGNIVGLEAASWRYFKRSPHDLSWGEAALLAVLPNNPANLNLLHGREALKKRRDALLDSLVAAGKLDPVVAASAALEPLPESLVPVERSVPAMESRIIRDGLGGQTVWTTIDGELQRDLVDIVSRHARTLAKREIHHLAVLVVDLEENAVRAYIGNTPLSPEGKSGIDVDIIQSARSSGSLFKPFLYAAMQDSGEMLPGELLVDIPQRFGSFYPQNYNRRFMGVVPADRALAQSLNVPYVKALAEYGVPRFKELLEDLGMTTLTRSAEDYGLPLIIGGAETTLWDMAGICSSLTRMVTGKVPQDSALQMPSLYRDLGTISARRSPISPQGWYLSLRAMQQLERPGIDNVWRRFVDQMPIAWKTGTSQGLRDAWAIGMSPSWLVGVWTGNSKGPGTAGLRGTVTAAPILFDVFRRLGPQQDFPRIDGLVPVAVSAESGFLPFPGDENIVYVDATPAAAQSARVSPYHQAGPRPVFTLPPVCGYYYSLWNPRYIPPSREHPGERMGILVPDPDAVFQLPIDYAGQSRALVFEAFHRVQPALLYWHLDGRYLGQTASPHSIEVSPNPGRHELAVVDEEGTRAVAQFTVEPGFREMGSDTPDQSLSDGEPD